MNKNLLMNFEVDKATNSIHVKREFDAPRDLVWKAWTEPEILDEWWAPKPWKTETKSMDFRNGGSWMYAMCGPEGEKHWCLTSYSSVLPKTAFTSNDAFCDENGAVNTDLPQSTWEHRFSESGARTLVTIGISFASPEDLEAIIKMGFREGFTMGLENLDQWIRSQYPQRKEN